MMPSESLWLVCQVLTGSEVGVQSWGLERGHEMYCPKMGVLKRLSRQRRNRQTQVYATRPAFPGYVFAEAKTDLAELARAPGFVDFVRFGPQLGALGGSEVLQIRAREAAGGFNEVDGKRPDLQVGDIATIEDGPLAGESVVLCRVRSNGDYDVRHPRLSGIVRLKPEMLAV